MGKFGVGCKVKFVRDNGTHTNGYKIGHVGTVIEVSKEGKYWIDNRWLCQEDELGIPDEVFHKKDLKDGSLVIFKNGDEAIFADNRFQILITNSPRISKNQSFIPIDDYEDNLVNNNCHDFDIIKIYKIKCDCIWIRPEKETIRELTMAEVEEKFGCKVKIIKEEK